MWKDLKSKRSDVYFDNVPQSSHYFLIKNICVETDNQTFQQRIDLFKK